ncbi:MAG TPA: hypothetical protein DCS07_13345 [Bdellovibrionales bacterium]|nr:hypothetical protein [Bdellovibrionales bacterium]
MDSAKTKTAIHPAFTVDAETTNFNEMPSVTRQLNRKKVDSSKSKKPSILEQVCEEQVHEAEKQLPPPFHPVASPPPASPQPSSSAHEITAAEDATIVHPTSTFVKNQPLSFPEVPVLPQENPSQEKVSNEGGVPAEVPLVPKKSERKKHELKLIIWDLATLRKGNDPLGKGLLFLVEKGVTSAVFLKIAPPKPGSTVPDFMSSATVQPQDKLQIWTGMRWDPTVSPEAWNQLLKLGYVEFPPPGTYTNLQSVRNVVRAAFGLVGDEWLTLIRVGTPTICRGILALISLKSAALIIPQALPILQVEPIDPKTSPTT